MGGGEGLFIDRHQEVVGGGGGGLFQIVTFSTKPYWLSH